MRLSLYQRLAFSLLGVFILIAVIFFTWWQHIEHKTRLQSEQALHLSLAANLARDNPLLQQGVYDHDALENLFHTLMVLGPAFEFYYLDPLGNIITYSADSSLVKRRQVDIAPLLALIQNRASLPVYGDDPRNLNRQKIFSAAPVFNGDKLQGYLYVIVTGELYDTAYQNASYANRIELSLVGTGLVLALLLVLLLWLFRYFTHPIRQLSRQIIAFEQAGFDQKVLKLQPITSNDDNEIVALTDVFQQMAQKITEQLSLLANADNKRRELLAEISHDLRTPLASLQGYLETIAIQGEELERNKQQIYLNIALKNTQQLKQLIDQIFELAHLEGGHVAINNENFNLIELLYDVVEKFNLQAQAKGIVLRVSNTLDNTNVYSDIAKVERILTNLIDNAIRHTPIDGEINLAVVELANNQLQVLISDNGTGIKSEEIPYIFDARYRASNATATKNTGLGLAITKKLLELLKSEITVFSELGKGTRFSFNLQKV